MPRAAPNDEGNRGHETRALSANLCRNLSYLCSFYPSVSEVCRRLGINRQQFNKYTSGAAFPSLHVLTRIADFFGVEVEELCWPPQELKQTFARRRQQREAATGFEDFTNRIQRLTDASSPALDHYVGFYHRYYYAFDQCGSVVRSLFQIRKAGGAYVTRHIERITSDGRARQAMTFKYDGIAVCMSNCIFITEVEILLNSCVSNAAFPMIPRPGQLHLFGIQTSLSSTIGRPGASRVVLERLKPTVPLRDALARCGIFRPDSGEIRPEMPSWIDNRNLTGESLFTPRVF
ncbi:MAG: helix-turn-helix domain-containing protein [Parvibaculaceae bacterium]